MQAPKIVSRPAATSVGLATTFIHALSPESNTTDVLGKLWCRFLEEVDRIPHRSGKEMYGIIDTIPEAERSHPHELKYAAAVAVSHADDLPEGMSVIQVPAMTCAVFVHSGPIERIGETVGYAYREWLPNSGYQQADLPDLEIYGAKFCGDSETSEMEYCIPIVP